jgi:hypothetical protein
VSFFEQYRVILKLLGWEKHSHKPLVGTGFFLDSGSPFIFFRRQITKHQLPAILSDYCCFVWHSYGKIGLKALYINDF